MLSEQTLIACSECLLSSLGNVFGEACIGRQITLLQDIIGITYKAETPLVQLSNFWRKHDARLHKLVVPPLLGDSMIEGRASARCEERGSSQKSETSSRR